MQLSDTLKTIVAHDYPERWPTLMQEAKRMLLSNDIREVHTGCIVALESIRAFKYVEVRNVWRDGLNLPTQISPEDGSRTSDCIRHLPNAREHCNSDAADASKCRTRDSDDATSHPESV